MKFAKTLALSAITAASVATVPAYAASGFYGFVNAALYSTSGDDGNDAVDSLDEAGRIRAQGNTLSGSRFGFRGSKSAHGLTGGVQIEYAVRHGSGSSPGMRHAYASLGGNWGTVRLGQTDSATNGAAEVDLTGNAIAGYNGNYDGSAVTFSALDSPLSRTQLIRYDSPKFAQIVQIRVSLAPEGGSETTDVERRSGTSGTNLQANGVDVVEITETDALNAHAISFALRFDGKTATGKFLGVIASDTLGGELDGDTASNLAVSGSYKFTNGLALTANYASRSYHGDFDPASIFHGKVGYDFGQGVIISANFASYTGRVSTADNEPDAPTGSYFGLQWYKKWKPINTEVYAFFRSTTLTTPQTGGADDEEQSETVLGAGMRVQFGVTFDGDQLSVM